MRWVWGIATAATILVAAVLYPQMVMIACLGHDSQAFGGLQELRGKVAAHRESTGRFPERLEDVGLPEMTVFSYGPQPEERIHWHKVTKVETRRGAGAAGFTVEFSTSPGPWEKPFSSVAILGDFNGFDPAKGTLARAPDGDGWSLAVAMSTGPHAYRWLIDGRERPLETRVFDHSLLGDWSARPARPQFQDLDGVWVYDPETGLVVLACDGGDTKHRRPWRTH